MLCRHEFHQICANGRVFLRCASCHVETPGWDLSQVRKPIYRPEFAKADARYDASPSKYVPKG